MIPYKILKIDRRGPRSLQHTEFGPSFVEIGKPKEMYQEFERVCTAIVLYLNCLVTRSIDITPGWNASSFVLPPPPSPMPLLAFYQLFPLGSRGDAVARAFACHQ